MHLNHVLVVLGSQRIIGYVAMADYSSWEIAMADCSSWEITMLNTPLSLWVNSTIYVQNTLKAKSSTLKTKFAGQINFTLFGWI